ncbi:hypothetical protein BRN99_14775 [Xanthomonas oryzae pv. oryzae]|nr:hypothetical protein BRN97_23315 [Xanthomonas oryzae pv. oryzae]RBB18808.1 hypothetical protein BRO13_14200 [Xanthomonas oryzae pv. oryzae]RBJ33946.1 hypothetical protein BRO10_13585 [Xanthomonas oryzae pv. oryzae]RBJ91235.1 hypothetical protein BRO05_25780 [Xanthomonas oryzae pv. oryzae]RBK10376.1 hypothetical protein BRN81_03000 [Xanthomonas oryzae pv. oryzae]
MQWMWPGGFSWATIELISDLRGCMSASFGELLGVLVDDRLETELGGQERLSGRVRCRLLDLSEGRQGFV